eukprot:13317587-Alexandrium_andersonii.AAC.1
MDLIADVGHEVYGSLKRKHNHGDDDGAEGSAKRRGGAGKTRTVPKGAQAKSVLGSPSVVHGAAAAASHQAVALVSAGGCAPVKNPLDDDFIT